MSRTKLSLMICLMLICSTAAVVPASANAQSNPNTTDVARQHPDWVQAPGELIRPECVHEIQTVPKSNSVRRRLDW